MSAGNDSRYEEIVIRLASAIRAARLYSATHPTVVEHTHALLAAVRQVERTSPSVLIGFVGGELIADDALLVHGSAARTDLSRDMQALGVHRLLIERGVTFDEIAAFVHAAASRPPARGDETAEDDEPPADFLTLPHLKAGHIPVDTSEGRRGSGAVEVRRVYGEAVRSAQTVWESAAADDEPALPVAREAVAHLAEAVGSSGGLIIGLTAMKEHDEYTFSHMVNTAILAMAQAATLGIEGEALRVLGLAAFLHDIGKVKTPLEVLGKPTSLSPAETAIMRRHPIDGALMLRATPSMPRLVPIVAFEHHLRADGSGYPPCSPRPQINLATALSEIADVYDAMRSDRQYHHAYAADRIIEVMKRNDGRHFDQRLVRRFVDLMGIYPPASLVRLDSGEVAVVIGCEGGDPAHPAVHVVCDPAGRRLQVLERRDLWLRPTGDGAVGYEIVATLDPAEHDIDAISVVSS